MTNRSGGDTTSDVRRLALEVLGRIERDGAYANLALRTALDRCDLDRRDRAFTTDLVYGTTRMRRACDYLIDRFLHDEIQPEVRTVLRLGAWQLAFGGVPPHAAVSTTVAVAPRRVRGLCNAVLRRVADEQLAGSPPWPSPAVALSCPDEVFGRMVADLGHDVAVAALEVMNRPAPAVVRDDGYHQDRASQLVVEAVLTAGWEGSPGHGGEWILDLCAAPGGKATALAASGARVVACDLRERRLGLVAENSRTLGSKLLLAVADGRVAPFRPGSFDRVLVDAPCSGLGVLRRRATPVGRRVGTTKRRSASWPTCNWNWPDRRLTSWLQAGYWPTACARSRRLRPPGWTVGFGPPTRLSFLFRWEHRGGPMAMETSGGCCSPRTWTAREWRRSSTVCPDRPG